MLVVFDGSDEDYITARNMIVGQPYDQVLCVKSTNVEPAYAIADRRNHIVNIHRQFVAMIANADWVFSVEDDGILPPYALSTLVNVAASRKNTGMVTGVELGRWGVPYVGAWRADNVFQPKLVRSMVSRAGEQLVEEIDACGLYCGLIRGDLYKLHTFFTDNGLGPDVNLGLYLRQCGFQNYIAWNVPVTHLNSRAGVEWEIPATDEAMIVTLSLQPDMTWQQSKTGKPA